MSVQPCPHCAAGTKCLTPVRTSAGVYWLILTKYSSCACDLSTVERARLIEQANWEDVLEASHGREVAPSTAASEPRGTVHKHNGH